MKIHILLTFFIAATGTLHTHAMTNELTAKDHVANKIKFSSSQESYEQLLAIHQEFNLSDITINKPIAQYSHQDREKLKEICEQLSPLNSINDLENLMTHNFKIGNDKDKLALFNAITQRYSPEQITSAIKLIREKYLPQHPGSNAVYINIESNDITQEVIEQDNTITIEAFKKDDSEDNEEIDIDAIPIKCIMATGATGFLGLFFSLWGMAFYFHYHTTS